METKHTGAVATILAERDRLLQVNAELVAALQAVTILASSSMAGAKANLSKAGSIARAALAKANQTAA